MAKKLCMHMPRCCKRQPVADGRLRLVAVPPRLGWTNKDKGSQPTEWSPANRQLVPPCRDVERLCLDYRHVW